VEHESYFNIGIPIAIKLLLPLPSHHFAILPNIELFQVFFGSLFEPLLCVVITPPKDSLLDRYDISEGALRN
jgi:hypothetical protein